ncbi:AIPR family protein [Novosphingobium sp. KA1]|uniref:AIPR family protein n=1 Tax=Novosphingobium sp. (strain KA1) TaxID=164608 RepID=UPI001F5DA221|nr:AIPR family protein [Novosphingobium sp. KA1]
MKEFHREFIAEIQGGADAEGLITTDAFMERVIDILDEAGEASSLAQGYFSGEFSGKKIQVDAYGWDPGDDEGVLSLVICDFVLSDEPQSIDAAGIKRQLRRLADFVIAANKRDFRERLEQTSNGFVVADLVARAWKQVSKIKLILVTNRINKARTDAQPIGSFGEIPVTSNVWDLSRLQRFVSSGQTREDLVIDFAEDFGEPIPVLKASFEGAPLDSYLAVVPGNQLAAIYDKWGARLLEANVRTFLQARGKVNQGMRDTIRKEPEMFFSYNNGLSATADSVEIADLGEGLLLMSAANFQIVNGGQTTASIHAARKNAPEQLKDVFVQMKLTIVPPGSPEEVVPSISRFANSQNKVNATDFFANHPFHIRMQEFSRRVLSPAGDSRYRETKWFYERARGQYADEKSRRTTAEQKKFEAQFPKEQFFTKVDLAKFENSYRCKPNIVSLGAEKNFGDFAKVIGTEWGKDGESFDEIWFRRLVAKGIIFRNLERLVPAQPWYVKGYRANIVTYAFAKVVHDAEQLKRAVDLDQVWRLQRVPVVLERAFIAAAEMANEVIATPLAGMRNISEWAKKQACWAELAKRKVEYEADFVDTLIDPAEAMAIKRDVRKERQARSAVEAQREAMLQGGEYWSQLLDFGLSIKKLSPKEVATLQACAAIPAKIPQEWQCVEAMKIADKLEQFYPQT